MFLVAAALTLGACASAGDAATDASSSAPSAVATPTHTATATPTPPTSSTPAAPTRADLDGTWCRASDSATCMTIEDGKTTDGATVGEATNDEGAPCLTVTIGSDGGFVAYYCPKGVSPATPVTTDAGAAVNLDNTAYERLFATQNPPYVDTWYREADLSAATAQ